MDRGLSLRRRLVGRSPTPILPFAPRSHPLLRFRSHLRPPLGSQSRATIIHPRRRPIGGSNPLSFPRQVASICSSSHRPTTLGTVVHRTAVFLRTSHHRPPCSILLRANQPYHELSRGPLLLINSKYHTGSHLSSPSSTTSSPIVFLTVARLPR
jgi:hypothetical protein